MPKKDTVASVLTPEQREEMRKTRDEMAKDKVAPPRGTTKKEADIFKEGITPPKDDEGPVSAAAQKRHSERLKTLWEREKKGRGLTQKQLADEANKDIGSSNDTGFKKGGSVSSASKRADGIAIRGKTRA
jgi:hypothetical protein